MKHAPLVGILTWQRSEHGYASLRYETCSDSCHRLMTTVRAWLFILKVWIMLWQLTSSHDNGQSMVIHLKIWNMLRQLSSWHDNGQSMVIHLLGMKHAPKVDIVSWQRSEHGYSSLRYKTCSDSCHRDMTTVRAWLFISNVWNMLRQLSSSHDNGQSMVIRLLGMEHAPTVVIVTWQRSEHGYSSLRYETCSVSCHRLMTTDRAWLFIPKVWNMLRQLSSWHDNCQSMVIHL